MIESYLADLGMVFHDHRLAEAIMASRRRDEEICRGEGDDVFFDRWWLRRKWREASAAHPLCIDNIYLHHFLRSDREDRHCHPWDNGTLVLRGSYVEDTPEGRFTRSAGEIVVRQAEQRHAIIEVEPGTISLFVTGPRRREWGFWPDDETFVPHKEYRAWQAARRAGGIIPDFPRVG